MANNKRFLRRSVLHTGTLNFLLLRGADLSELVNSVKNNKKIKR